MAVHRDHLLDAVGSVTLPGRASISFLRSIKEHRLRLVVWGPDAMLDMLCNMFQMESSSLTLLTGQAIHVLAAKGKLSAGICPDRWGFCGWSFLSPQHEVLVIEDLQTDARCKTDGWPCCDLPAAKARALAAVWVEAEAATEGPDPGSWQRAGREMANQ